MPRLKYFKGTNKKMNRAEATLRRKGLENARSQRKKQRAKRSKK